MIERQCGKKKNGGDSTRTGLEKGHPLLPVRPLIPVPEFKAFTAIKWPVFFLLWRAFGRPPFVPNSGLSSLVSSNCILFPLTRKPRGSKSLSKLGLHDWFIVVHLSDYSRFSSLIQSLVSLGRASEGHFILFSLFTLHSASLFGVSSPFHSINWLNTDILCCPERAVKESTKTNHFLYLSWQQREPSPGGTLVLSARFNKTKNSSLLKKEGTIYLWKRMVLFI